MTRQANLGPKGFNAAQKAEYETFLKTRRARNDGSLGGPFDPWITNAELFHRLSGLGGMLWARTSLDRGIVELAICITAKFWEANLEWGAHAPRAVEYGIPRAALDSILAGHAPKGWPLHETVYDVCMEMHRHHRLSKDLYAEAVEALGEQGLAELMAVIGFYTLVSMTLNAFEVQPTPEMEAPFRREP